MKPAWDILLIGGASASGKTTLAEALASHYDCRSIDADLFWIVLQRALTSDQEPDLHLFDSDSIWLLPAQEIVKLYQRVAACVCRYLEPVVAHHSIIGRRAIIEGVWLTPAFAKQGEYAARHVPSVRSLFIHETSAEEIRRRILSRPTPWLSLQRADIQAGMVGAQVAYGDEVRREALAAELTVLEAQPLDSLFGRAVAALEAQPL